MKDVNDLLAELRAEYAERALTDYDDALTYLVQPSESPIEHVLAAALIVEAPLYNRSVNNGTDGRPFLLFWDRDDLGETFIVLQSQVNQGPYRPDFSLAAGFKAHEAEKFDTHFRAIIECDGHEFHERTKDQAARDKRRDRWFQIRGISVLRFTGAEIWADPIGCAWQVYEAFSQASIRRRRDR
jgi:Protein of unknown function (DUF559)